MNNNLANKLTVLRLFLILPFMFFTNLTYSIARPLNIFFNLLALAIFILATITDYYDGKIARETNTITDFGKLLDPIADKLLTFSFLAILVYHNQISIFVVLILLVREIIITEQRIYLTTVSAGVLAASKLGKLKTISMFISIVIILIMPISPASLVINNILFIPAIVLSLLSAKEYHEFFKEHA